MKVFSEIDGGKLACWGMFKDLRISIYRDSSHFMTWWPRSGGKENLFSLVNVGIIRIVNSILLNYS
jgi:hypothetical protein